MINEDEFSQPPEYTPNKQLRAVVAKNRAGQKVTFSDHQVS